MSRESGKRCVRRTLQGFVNADRVPLQLIIYLSGQYVIFSKNIELQIICDSPSVVSKRTGRDTMEFQLPEVNQDIRYIRLNQPRVVPSCDRWRLGVLLVRHLRKFDTLDVPVIDAFV